MRIVYAYAYDDLRGGTGGVVPHDNRKLALTGFEPRVFSGDVPETLREARIAPCGSRQQDQSSYQSSNGS